MELDRQAHCSDHRSNTVKILSMDTIILVMVGSWVSVTTALTFLEVRRIRKKMDARTGTSATASHAAD